MKKILVCFDGTGNEPEDAVQDVSGSGEVADQNISNVLKLHLRSGGRLGVPVESHGQLSLYYPGPGTHGGRLRRGIDAAIASGSLNTIKNKALGQLREVYADGDEISVFGFSRGAAIARRFVAHLQRSGLVPDGKDPQAVVPVPVAFLGVWDTVLSEGAPQKDRDERPPSEVGEETGIGNTVASVCHLVSIDDPRKVFTPTLFQADDRVTELWFAGVHSDVGGGYRVAGLSDITLDFMLNRAANEGGLTFLEPDDVDLRAASSIEPDDLACTPDPAADDHVGAFDSFLKEAADAIAPREVRAFADGVPPVLHESVVERGKTLRRYRPQNLSATRHTIHGSAVVHESFEEHFQGV